MMMSLLQCKLTLQLVRDAVVRSGSGQDAFTEKPLKHKDWSDQDVDSGSGLQDVD